MDNSLQDVCSPEQLQDIHNLESIDILSKNVESQTKYKYSATKNSPSETPISSQKLPSKQNRKRYRSISPEIKELVATQVLWNGAMTYEQAAEIFDISPASVSKIISQEKKRIRNKESRDTSSVEPPIKRAKNPPLSIEIWIHLLSQLELYPSLTLQELAQIVKDKFGIETSVLVIAQGLHKLEITWKNVLEIPQNWNNPEIIKSRFQFINKMKEFTNRTIVFVDKMEFNLHWKHLYQRIPAQLTLAPKEKQISLVAALSSSGIVHHTIINNCKEGFDVPYVGFFFDLASKIPRESLVIVDNTKIGSKLGTAPEMLKIAYGIDLLFLPSCSPFLNPMEYAFKDIKTTASKSTFYNYDELINSIQQHISTLTPEKTRSYITTAHTYHQQVLNNRPFAGNMLSPKLTEDIN